MARKITRSPGRGKKIDTFTYDVVTPAGDKKRSVAIDVYMSKCEGRDAVLLRRGGTDEMVVLDPGILEVTGCFLASEDPQP